MQRCTHWATSFLQRLGHWSTEEMQRDRHSVPRSYPQVRALRGQSRVELRRRRWIAMRRLSAKPLNGWLEQRLIFGFKLRYSWVHEDCG